MLRVTVLGSGSRGNAILIDGSRGSVLIDAGFGVRSLARRFAAVDRRPEQVGALLLTHEHVDHASGATASSSRWRWPVYAPAESLDAMQQMPGGVPASAVALTIGTPLPDVAGFEVATVTVPHDAAACVAYVLTDIASGARVGVTLDSGHVTEALPVALARCDLLVLESNHDERMLAEGPYPWPLKQRIAGKSGHLSNGACAALLADVAHVGLRGVMLAHLSETNNTPAIAIARTREALRRAGWRRDALWAAAQSVPSGPVGLSGATEHGVAAQLSLGF